MWTFHNSGKGLTLLRKRTYRNLIQLVTKCMPHALF